MEEKITNLEEEIKLKKHQVLKREFFDFLREYKVFSLAIAFIMGGASISLVNALVKDILMPIVEPFMAASWKEAVFTIGPVHIVYGAFLAEVVNFLLLSLIVFIVAKKILKIEREKKGK